MADVLSQYLSRCAWNGIEFPATRVVTTGGHDKVEHVAHLVPGADIEEVGRKALRVSIEVPLYNNFRGWDANQFPGTWRRLFDELDRNPIGTLTHPTRGNFEAHFDEFTETVAGRGPRNGVPLTLQFTEHNADASLQLDDTGAQTTQAQSDPSTAVDASYSTMISMGAAALGNVILAVDPTLVIPPLLDSLRSSTLRYTEAVRAFASILAAAQFLLGVSGLSSAAGHDARVAINAFIAAVNRYQDSYFGTTAPQVYVVPVPMSLVRIASVIYGDASKAVLLRNANQIPDELFVPAGTRLLVL